MPVDGGEDAVAELADRPLQADGAQPMLDIAAGLGLIERPEMIGGG